MKLKTHLVKADSVNKNTFVLLFVLCFVSILELQAQLGFCTGNSGDPIFTENFGIGLGNNPLPVGTTTYSYTTTGYPGDGFYTVRNGTLGNAFDWHQTQDHTPNDTNGKALIVNAAAGAGEFYRTTVSGLCETTTYEFSAWVMNLVKANSFCSGQPGGTIPINVRFEIWDSSNTILIKAGNTGNIIETSNPIWQEYGLVFQTQTGQNSVILKMINNGQGGCGNDLAIDDIEFKSCGDSILITDSNNNNSVSLCSSQAPFTSTLTATPDFSVYGSHFFQWQVSTDAGITWNDIAGETNQSISISTVNTRYYRTKVAEVAVNLNNPQCVSFSNIYQAMINQLPTAPTLACWETATINNTTCAWEITGTQPVQPTTQCWETATFNTTTCAWEITGAKPIQPLAVNCWDNWVFNNTTCVWDNSGSQQVQPTTQCWETATFNTTTCAWEITGTQPVQPATQCWQTATFNNTTCIWEVTGTQPVQPTTQCWETATFNTTTCIWSVTGTQPVQPTTSCWETATFNLTTCSWNVSGTQPLAPIGLQCWQTTSFNTLSCVWDIVGMQPGSVYTQDLVYCDGASLTLQANTSLLNTTYLWSTGETTDFITVNSPGAYTVEITSPTCFFETRIFNVTQAAIPSIDNVTSDGRNIVVITSNSGDFLYSLDGNIYQPSNTFLNIKGGIYTIYVRERNCPDIDTKTHLHFFVPKYFTPNNDGVNDTFSLSGIEFYTASEVSIFNRYGKLVKFSQNGPFSWDGTFNSAQLPSDDYWYVIIIDGQKLTGHFTLKR